ncbi:MAG TPA: hypothetical protein DEA96_09940 [Leptospiraceae bacterium]|nr:hypothetical protein [Spirochaetaceae bacterium]HBS05276.1 hypothetical protein [Leptospiraceae bacterium]|tara:strand:+ start:37264 stop:37791 length:528 start_codon:yes stop_codon:yes gene_type:complete
MERFRTILLAAIIASVTVGAAGSFLFFYLQQGLDANAEPVTDRSPPEDSIEPVQHGNLTVYRNPAGAFELARKQGQPVFLDFYADWCGNCVKFQKRMLEDKALNQALQQAVVLQVIDTDPAFEHYSREGRFPELNEALPLFAVLNAKNELIWKGQNYLDSDSMIQAMKEATATPK